MLHASKESEPYALTAPLTSHEIAVWSSLSGAFQIDGINVIQRSSHWYASWPESPTTSEQLRTRLEIYLRTTLDDAIARNKATFAAGIAAWRLRCLLALGDTSDSFLEARIRRDLGSVLNDVGEPLAAKIQLETALELLKTLSPTDANDHFSEMALLHGHLGVSLLMTRDPVRAKLLFEKGLTLAAQPNLASTPQLDRTRAWLHIQIGSALMAMSHFQEAKAQLEAALTFQATIQPARKADLENTRIWLVDRARTHWLLAQTLMALGNLTGATPECQQALNLCAQPELENYPKRDVILWRARCSLADAFRLLGDLRDAKEGYVRALSLCTTHDFAENQELDYERAILHKNVGDVLLDLNQGQEAQTHFAQAMALFSRPRFMDKGRYEGLEFERVELHVFSGRALAHLEKWTESKEQFEQALVHIARPYLAQNAHLDSFRAEVHRLFAATLAMQGDWMAVKTQFEKALAILDNSRLARDHSLDNDRLKVYVGLSMASLALDDLSEAKARYKQGYEVSVAWRAEADLAPDAAASRKRAQRVLAKLDALLSTATLVPKTVRLSLITAFTSDRPAREESFSSVVKLLIMLGFIRLAQTGGYGYVRTVYARLRRAITLMTGRAIAPVRRHIDLFRWLFHLFRGVLVYRLSDIWSGDDGVRLAREILVQALVMSERHSVESPFLNIIRIQGRRGLGRIAFELRDFDGAIEHYRRSLILLRRLPPHWAETFHDGKLVETYRTFGTALYLKGDMAAAVSNYKLALPLNEQDLSDKSVLWAERTMMHLNLARAFKKWGADDRAKTYHQSAIELSDRLCVKSREDLLLSVIVQSEVGACADDLGDSCGAIEANEKVLAILDEFHSLAVFWQHFYRAQLHVNIAVSLLRHGDASGSVRECREALSSYEKGRCGGGGELVLLQAKALLVLGGALNAVGDFGGALAQWELAANTLLRTPAVGVEWFEQVKHLGERLGVYVQSVAGKDILNKRWLEVIDQLSEQQVQALDLQPRAELDDAHAYATDFHATYLTLCVRYSLAERIPSVLARIHGKRLGVLMSQQLIETPPDSLCAEDIEYLDAKRKLAELAVKGAPMTRAIEPQLEGFAGRQRSKASVSRELSGEHYESIVREWDRLIGQLKELELKLKNDRLRLFLRPPVSTIADIQAQLMSREAALLLVDLPTTVANWKPFALFVPCEGEVLPPVLLPELPRLTQLLEPKSDPGARGVERRGETGSLGEDRLWPVGEDDLPDPEVRALELAWQLSLLRALCRRLRADEPVLDTVTFHRWDQTTSGLLRSVEQLEQGGATTNGGKDRLIDGLQQAITDYAEHLFVDSAEAERLMRRYLWAPLQKQLGAHLLRVDSLAWITHGQLHGLPYDAGRPPDFPKLYHYPGALFLRRPSQPPAWAIAPFLVHANDASDGKDARGAIPFVHSSQAIDERFLGEFVGTPLTTLGAAIVEPRSSRRYNHASINGHGSRDGLLLLHAPRGEAEREASVIRWDGWIAQELHVDEVELWTCFLGRIEESRGEPLGWAAALRLTGTTAMVGAVRSISDFWTPLLQILYRQTQFLAQAPKREPQEALAEAKRRLLSWQWYTPKELAPAYRGESTSDLICRFYPLGMMAALELMLDRDCSDRRLHRLLGDWPLPDHWRERLPPLGERSKAARQKKTTFFDALRADAGEALILDTLAVLTDTQRLGAMPEVQTALTRLASSFVCFGRAEATAS